MLRSRSALTCPGGKLNTTLLTSRSQAETTVDRGGRGEREETGNGDVGAERRRDSHLITLKMFYPSAFSFLSLEIRDNDIFLWMD